LVCVVPNGFNAETAARIPTPPFAVDKPAEGHPARRFNAGDWR
jgi:hypothetical protein